MRYLFFITNYLLTIQNACRGLFWFNSEKTRTPLSFVTETYVLSFLKITIVLFLPFFLLQNTFHYDNAFWSNKETFNLSGGKTGFDDHETKLPTYWNTSFSKICLGMKINNQIDQFYWNHWGRQFPVFTDRWWAIPQDLTGSWQVEVTDSFWGLLADEL